MEYILFVGQEGNCQSRCMIIPAKEYLEHNKGDYDILKKYVQKITLEGIEINALFDSYKREGNSGTQIITEYSKICNNLTSYADGMDEDCYYEREHKPWVDKCIGIPVGGFNHVKNYTMLKNPNYYKEGVVIIDSFLFIENIDGKIHKPPFDTVNEMLVSLHLREVPS